MQILSLLYLRTYLYQSLSFQKHERRGLDVVETSPSGFYLLRTLHHLRRLLPRCVRSELYDKKIALQHLKTAREVLAWAKSQMHE